MFTPFQKKVFAFALTCAAICVIGAFAVLLFALAAQFLSAFAAVVAPIAAALILSFILSPAVGLVSRKLRISAGAACALVFVLLAAFAAAFAALAVPRAVSEASRLCAEVPHAIDTAARVFAEKFPESKAEIAKRIAELKEAASENLSLDCAAKSAKQLFKTAAAATGGLTAFFSFAAAFAVAPIYLYYMLASKFDFYSRLEGNLKFLPPSKREDVVFFARRFAEIMSAFFRGQMLIALIMGLLLGTGLMLAGVRFGFMLGFCAGMLNIVPYLGTIIGLGTILPVAALQDGGGWVLASVSLAVFCAVQCLEGYVLTPKIMGERTGLHPTVIIFSVFFWGIALGGILGMVLAIPLTAFAVAAWERIYERWIAAAED